jgi:hypothetical protein
MQKFRLILISAFLIASTSARSAEYEGGYLDSDGVHHVRPTRPLPDLKPRHTAQDPVKSLSKPSHNKVGTVHSKRAHRPTATHKKASARRTRTSRHHAAPSRPAKSPGD